jgi:uncharacterized protein (TIGR00725 family)
MRAIIGVCGSGCLDDSHASKLFAKAERIGYEIAEHKGIVVCGGKGGIMEAVCKGAKQNNGLTVGILPYELEEMNPYVDIPIVTGMGEKRNSLIVKSSDCIIVLAGRWGTLNEITLAVIYQKPLVFLKGSGGFVDLFLQSDLIKHVTTKYVIVEDEKEAVEYGIRLAKERVPKD